MKLGKTGRNGIVFTNKHDAAASEPLIEVLMKLNDGRIVAENIPGKKLLVVNTASDCGYTGQFAGLQELYEKHKNSLLILGFPANDFKEQEGGDDKQINEFCQVNYGVTFPILKKSRVVKGKDQNPVFRWLSDPNKNGWNDQEPVWNFSKYLIDENGKLLGYFGPAISPLDPEIVKRIG